MRARKRLPEPLNFTPEEPSARDSARGRMDAKPKPAPTRASATPPAPAEAGPAVPPASPPISGAVPLGLGRSTLKRAPELGIARHAYLVAAIASVGWAGMLVAYEVGYVGGWNLLLRSPGHLAVLMALALLPGLFLFTAAFVARQGASLAAEARWAHSLADDLTTPMALAAARTGDLVGAMREEVERAAAAAQLAQDQLVAVRQALAAETDRLTETAAEAQRTARVMGETLAHERGEVGVLLSALGDESRNLSDGVDRQTRLVAETSDLARSQLHEAEAALAASAASLAGAGADAAIAAQDAGEALAQQAERLDISAAALSERLRFLDARLSDQRNALSNLAHGLQADEEEIAVRLESHRAQLMSAIGESRAGAEDLARASDAGAEALRAMTDAAARQIVEFTDSVRANRALLASEAQAIHTEAEDQLRDALLALAGAAEDARQATASQGDAARDTAEAHVAAARTQIEQLGQLAFDAGQRANQAFDARIAEARRLIEQAAVLVEDAGTGSAERIEAGLMAARGALGDLNGALADIDARMARLPETAQRQVDSIRTVVERGVGDMATAARNASEETKALDAAFQDRIRRNYETLSEAVRLMGRVAGPGGAPAASQAQAQVQAQAQAAPQPAPQPAQRAPSRAAPPEPEDAPEAAGKDAAANGRWSVQAKSDFPHERKPAFSGGRPAQPVFGRALRAEDGEPPAPRVQAEAPVAPAPASRPAPMQMAAQIAAAPEPPPRTPNDEPGLRPRLKLTPTAADEALKAVFDPPRSQRAAPERVSERTSERGPERAPDRGNGRAQPEGDLDEWTWKDLLSSMDAPPTDVDSLAEQMIREIEQLGVDAASLLPPLRVEELAEVMLDGDAATARDALRRLAPAAIRRLSRRVLTDKDLREQADRFVARYDGLLRDAASHDDGLHRAAHLLGSDAGRAYLLLDAAVGDL